MSSHSSVVVLFSAGVVPVSPPHRFHEPSFHLIVSGGNAIVSSQQSKEDDGQSEDYHDWSSTDTPRGRRQCFHFSFGYNRLPCCHVVSNQQNKGRI